MLACTMLFLLAFPLHIAADPGTALFVGGGADRVSVPPVPLGPDFTIEVGAASDAFRPACSFTSCTSS